MSYYRNINEIYQLQSPNNNLARSGKFLCKLKRGLGRKAGDIGAPTPSDAKNLRDCYQIERTHS